MTKDQISPPSLLNGGAASRHGDMEGGSKKREGFGLIESSDPCSDKIK